MGEDLVLDDGRGLIPVFIIENKRLVSPIESQAGCESRVPLDVDGILSEPVAPPFGRLEAIDSKTFVVRSTRAREKRESRSKTNGLKPVIDTHSTEDATVPISGSLFRSELYPKIATRVCARCPHATNSTHFRHPCDSCPNSSLSQCSAENSHALKPSPGGVTMARMKVSRGGSPFTKFSLVFALLSTPSCVPKSADSPGSAVAPNDTPASGSAVAQPLSISFPHPPEFVAPQLGNLKRGINLGNGFDPPTLGAWGVVPDEKHFTMARSAGLDHMRLPVRFSAHALKEAPYTIDEDFFKKIDWAVDQALANQLSIIIDLHHYEEIMKDPDAHADRLVGLWQQIALRYQNRPPEVLFELLNEPNESLVVEKLNPLMARVIDTIRQSNPTRSLIINGYFWAAANQLTNIQLPDDKNLAASFHMYQPILFTHQGADWMPPEFRSRGIVFPGPPNVKVIPTAQAAETGWTSQWLQAHNTEPTASNPSSVATVAREFDYATIFAKQRGIPVYLGEFGAIDFADPTSRENYIRLVRLEAERRGFAWALWDDGGRNKAMELKTETWIAPVARALFTDQPGQALKANIQVQP